MSTGKQTPMGIDALTALLQNTGLTINPGVTTYVGTSHTNTSYTPGTIVTATALNYLVQAIQNAYPRLATSEITSTTYNNLISIGSTTIPALGDSKPNTYTFTGYVNNGDPDRNDPNPGVSWLPYDSTNPVTQAGFIRLFALQAWNEFNWNGPSTATTVLYKDFLATFSNCESVANYNNKSINIMNNASTFLEGTYSNMDDLITADIAGVNLAMRTFGQDLIALGKVIDLGNLEVFGLPSVLLRTIKRYNAITQSLSLALLASELQVSEVEKILAGATPSKLQEQKIYSAFLLILGVDLADVLIPLNCKTEGLNSLADLLNPMKLLPNSYLSLTVPVYNVSPGPTNSKTYYPIYNGSGVNTTLNSDTIGQYFGLYLEGILPTDVAIACGAFGVAMRQIKKIKGAPIEKFAQVVANLETTKNLTLVGGTNVPVDPTATTAAAQALGQGSGPNGTYTMSDFFGCMSGLPYAWKDIQTLITQLQTSALVTTYTNLYSTVSAGPASSSPGDIAAYNTAIQTLINTANSQITAIKIANPITANTLNKLYDNIGTQLTIEQTARNNALTPVPYPGRDPNLSQYPGTIYSFIDTVPIYAEDTLPHMTAQTIEAIADWSFLGGQSLVGMMRQSRNKTRLASIGIPLDDDVSEELSESTTNALIANGTVPTNRSGIVTNAGITYTIPSVPSIDSPPEPSGFYDGVYKVSSGRTSSTANVISTTSLGQLLDNFVPAIPQVGPVVVLGTGTTLDTGQAVEPGSFAGSPYRDLIPPNLNTVYTSKVLSPAVLSVPEAIDQVITCNCDCWVN